jgi:hypothetical protein
VQCRGLPKTLAMASTARHGVGVDDAAPTLESVMSISTIALAFIRYPGSGAAAAPAPSTGVAAVPAAAPAPVPAPPAAESHGDSPRKSPLFQALVSALSELASAVPAADAAESTTAAPAAETDAAAPAAAADNPDVDQAVFKFARALMQALRGRHVHDGEGDGEHHDRGHHYGHHRDRWHDPVARLESLATRVDAAAAAAATPDQPATGSNGAPTAEAAMPDTAPAAPADATTAAAATVPAGAGSTLIVVALAKSDGPAAASPYGGMFDRLLDSFAHMQQALGKPAAADRATLAQSLSAFLEQLAARLRGDAPSMAADPTAPGALIDVAA